jgi:hypothetical protein
MGSPKRSRTSAETWEKSLVGKIAGSPRNGLIAHYELDGNLSDVSGRYQHGRTVSGDPTFGSGQVGKAVSFDGDSHVSFGKTGTFESSDPFSVAVWLRGSGNTPVAALQKIDNHDTRRGFEFLFDDLELVGIQGARHFLRSGSPRIGPTAPFK